MENSKIAALVELGILCRGEPVDVHGNGTLDPGPHTHSDHDQLCKFEVAARQYPFENPSVAIYDFHPAGMDMDTALEKTRLIVILGAADSEELRACLASPGAIVVLFEPDDRVLIEFLESVKLAGLNRQNFFCFTGNPYSFNPALQDMLPEGLFRVGTPAFFMTERIRQNYGEWAHQVIEYFEILHYRTAIYPVAGQALCRSQPVRNIHRGLMFDQQLHTYQNIGAFLKHPPLTGLRNVMRGETAILVGAGPDLNEKCDYILKNQDKAVVICVNNAIKTVVDAGIKPHFVIINDNSIESGRVFDHIPELPGTILVGHSLSNLGGDKFRQKYLFGSFLPHLFGERGMLRLHGSVISTAFSLAQFMGCAKCVLIGAQLASNNPWGLSYAKGAVDKDLEEEEKPLIGRYPQLYPVTTPFGVQLYTTTNFLDSALWLAETIRLSGVDCINTSRSSILYGYGISYDPEPELPDRPIDKAMSTLFRAEPPQVDRQGIGRYIRHELQMWTTVSGVADAMLKEAGPGLLAKGMAILEQLDKNNVTYLVERHWPEGDAFDTRYFHRQVFQGDDTAREEGLRYYFRHVKMISERFLDLLKDAAKLL